MSQIFFISKKKICWRKTTPWHTRLPWKTVFTGKVARGSWFRPLVETSLLKPAFCTASVPLCRGNWSRPEAATRLFSLTVHVFLLHQIMVLHLSIQPSHHSSTLDISLASQGDGASSGLTLGRSGEVLQEPLLSVCTIEG